MFEKIKQLWIKYEEIIAYLIVGVLTTIVSINTPVASAGLIYILPEYSGEKIMFIVLIGLIH